MSDNQNGQAAEQVAGQKTAPHRSGTRLFNFLVLLTAGGTVAGTITVLVGIDPVGDDRLAVGGVCLIAASVATYIAASTLLAVRLLKDRRATRERESG